MSTPGTLRSRVVFYIGGYDPKNPDAFFERLDREAARSAKAWNIAISMKDAQGDGPRHFTARAASGTCVTDFHFIGLDDIVLKDFSRPLWTRFGRYAVTIADYFGTGTAFSIARQAWRFFLYFLYPLMMILFGICIAIGAGYIADFFSVAWLFSVLIGLFTFAVLVQFIFKRWFVLHLMDLWSFGRDFLRKRRADIEAKLDDAADNAAMLITQGRYDEALFVGHSTGGALILSMAARTEERLADTEIRTRPGILTVGSTALKVGLHPAAGWFRKEVQAIATSKRWTWLEFQALTDIINFYRSNPAELMGTTGASKPIVQTVRMKEMVDAATYKRMKGNFFRMHYQFVFGNSKRYRYDFPAICFAPLPLAAWGEPGEIEAQMTDEALS